MPPTDFGQCFCLISWDVSRCSLSVDVGVPRFLQEKQLLQQNNVGLFSTARCTSQTAAAYRTFKGSKWFAPYVSLCSDRAQLLHFNGALKPWKPLKWGQKPAPVCILPSSLSAAGSDIFRGRQGEKRSKDLAPECLT